MAYPRHKKISKKLSSYMTYFCQKTIPSATQTAKFIKILKSKDEVELNNVLISQVNWVNRTLESLKKKLKNSIEYSLHLLFCWVSLHCSVACGTVSQKKSSHGIVSVEQIHIPDYVCITSEYFSAFRRYSSKQIKISAR